jgi:hypothetical protein
MRENIPDRLEKKVNDMIAKGWKPQGGIAVLYIGLTPVYFQAMIKK